MKNEALNALTLPRDFTNSSRGRTSIEDTSLLSYRPMCDTLARPLISLVCVPGLAPAACTRLWNPRSQQTHQFVVPRTHDQGKW